jgi:hypothetical protein
MTLMLKMMLLPLLAFLAPQEADPKPLLVMKGPPRTAPAEAERIFRRILEPLPVRRVKDTDPTETLLDQLLAGRSPEIRLFAAAFPDLALRLSVARLQDPAAPPHEKAVALQVVGQLGSRTSPALESILVKLAGSGPEESVGTAVACLGARDPSGKHRELHRSLCRRGVSSAFNKILRLRDGKTRDFLKELAAGRREAPMPEGGAPALAERALRDLELLEAPDRARRIEERILAASDDAHLGDLLRAVEYGRQLGMKNLKDLLARRLAPMRAAFEGENPAQAGTTKTWRKAPLYDEFMLVHAERGGAPTPFEFARLRHYCLAGDPEEILLERMREEPSR